MASGWWVALLGLLLQAKGSFRAGHSSIEKKTEVAEPDSSPNSLLEGSGWKKLDLHALQENESRLGNPFRFRERREGELEYMNYHRQGDKLVDNTVSYTGDDAVHYDAGRGGAITEEAEPISPDSTAEARAVRVDSDGWLSAQAENRVAQIKQQNLIGSEGSMGRSMGAVEVKAEMAQVMDMKDRIRDQIDNTRRNLQLLQDHSKNDRTENRQEMDKIIDLLAQGKNSEDTPTFRHHHHTRKSVENFRLVTDTNSSTSLAALVGNLVEKKVSEAVSKLESRLSSKFNSSKHSDHLDKTSLQAVQNFIAGQLAFNKNTMKALDALKNSKE